MGKKHVILFFIIAIIFILFLGLIIFIGLGAFSDDDDKEDQENFDQPSSETLEQSDEEDEDTSNNTELKEELVSDEVYEHGEIKISNIEPNGKVTSPLNIKGEAAGWYFEGSFPIKILNEKGEEIGEGLAKAEGDWMTGEFVPFQSRVIFVAGDSEKGTIVFHKDNPSGLPELDDSFELPVNF